MRTHNLAQGSAEWHAHRLQSFNASDAPAVLGCSPYTTRSELLQRLHTGLTPEVDAGTQRRFDDGHRFEALARPLAEEIIGDELAPLVGSLEVEGLSRPLSASFDGLTFLNDTGFEHKTLNADLRACMRDQGNGYSLPKHYQVQMEQQLLVSGAERILFMASEWTGDGTLMEERHCWYASDQQLRDEILAGWKQFDADLAAYVPPAPSTVEKIIAEPVEALPAPTVTVTGQLALQDNFKVFEQRLRHFLEHRLIRQPKTDQDFADLDAQIKSMKQARESLKAAEAQMLAQVEPVDQAKKTKDMLDKLLQQNLSMAERLLKEEKERRRGEIVASGFKGLNDHIAAINQRLGKNYMPPASADFGGVIRGLKSLASMEDKVATELARAKAAANEAAASIALNLQTLAGVADKAFLFADERTLVLKAPEDCRAVIAARITEHERKEAERLERIRQEERAKAEREAAEKLRREQEAREAEERRQRAAAEEAERQRAAAAAEAQRREDAVRAEQQRQQQAVAIPPTAVAGGGAVGEGADAVRIAHAAGPAVIPMPTRTPTVAPVLPSLRLGEIQKHLAPLSITAEGLRQLGFEPAGKQGAAVLYMGDELPYILTAAIQHLTKARDQLVKAA